MLKHLFLCGLAFFILTSVWSLIYMLHVKRQTAIEINRSAERIKHENPKTIVTELFAKTPLVANTSREDCSMRMVIGSPKRTSRMSLPWWQMEKQTPRKHHCRDAGKQRGTTHRMDCFSSIIKIIVCGKIQSGIRGLAVSQGCRCELCREADADWVKIPEQIENLHSVRKKVIVIWGETPVYPTQWNDKVWKRLSQAEAASLR